MIPLLPTLRVTPWRLAVCKLPAARLPAWAEPSAFISFSVTQDEASLVCEEALVPTDVKAELGWRCISVDGPLDFGLVGIVSRITTLLAGASISVFVISTFDTDYILIKHEKLDAAASELTRAGYSVSY